jgi:hypothetical protein
MTLAVNIAQSGSSNVTFRNRIINGNMVVDQRNAGASVTIPITNATYTLDRWVCYGSQGSKFTVQQNAASVTPPAGFANYLGVTSLSAYTVGSTESFWVRQSIEGYNIADLSFGTVNAKTVTLSFQVYSSLTGTFGGALQNSAQNRSYPFNYSVSVANTWTTISISIAGDTTGTWLNTNGIGIGVIFSMGAGSAYSGTSNAWAGSNLYQPTGSVSVVGTNGATFYITGVQLEAGTTASPFEYRQYGTELALCQRYYWKSLGAGNESVGVAGYNVAGNAVWSQFGFPVTMRATPTVTVNGTWAVSNTGQPTIRAASATNFLLQAAATGTAALATYPNTSDDFLDASIEL